jgi:hypothetical protein
MQRSSCRFICFDKNTKKNEKEKKKEAAFSQALLLAVAVAARRVATGTTENAKGGAVSAFLSLRV